MDSYTFLQLLVALTPEGNCRGIAGSSAFLQYRKDLGIESSMKSDNEYSDHQAVFSSDNLGRQSRWKAHRQGILPSFPVANVRI